MRICIVTPGHLATNPRVVKEAGALARAGHATHVIHGRYEPFYAQHDAALADGFTRTPAPFGPQLAPRATYLRQAALSKAARLAARAGVRDPLTAATALAPVSNDLAAAAAATPADLYIGHYVAALPAVARAARRAGVAYAFDAEDFHPGDLPEGPAHAFDRGLIEAVERPLLPGCAFMTAASPGIADAYAERYGVPQPTTILNVFPKANAPAAPTPHGAADPRPSVYWFSQTIGPNRGLECAVRALARARSRPHLHLRGAPAAGYRDALTALAQAEGVADRLHFHDPAPPPDMERLAAAFDVGLVGETGATPNRRIALTNKQFTYLLAGTPAVMSDVPAHRRFAADAEGAAFLYAAEDPDALAAALDRLLADPAVLAAARARAHAHGQATYNWDVEAQRLVALVEDSVEAAACA